MARSAASTEIASADTSAAPSARMKRALPTVLLVLAAAAVASLLWFADPNAADSPLPPCPFHALTGWFCPGCGSTRTLHALLHGDIGQAMSMNPLLVLALPVLALMAVNAAGWWSPRDTLLWRVLRSPKFWLWLLLGYWIARNLPWWPFSWLAPG